MTTLEAALLTLVVFAAFVIWALAARVAHLEREPCRRIHWEPLQYWRGDSWGPDEVWLGGRGGGKAMARAAAPTPRLVEGQEIVFTRLDGTRRHYRLVGVTGLGGTMHLEPLDH